jgi:hypothetical protein
MNNIYVKHLLIYKGENGKTDSQNIQLIPRRSGAEVEAVIARCTKGSKFSTYKIICINVGRRLEHIEIKGQNNLK